MKHLIRFLTGVGTIGALALMCFLVAKAGLDLFLAWACLGLIVSGFVYGFGYCVRVLLDREDGYF